MKNKYFCFISDESRGYFAGKHSSNIDIANIIQDRTFKVLQIAIPDGDVVSIQFEDGSIFDYSKNGIYINKSEIEDFFTEVSGFESKSEAENTQDTTDEIENDLDAADPASLVIEGPAKIELTVTDEKSRLAAIKFLEGIRFANV